MFISGHYVYMYVSLQHFQNSWNAVLVIIILNQKGMGARKINIKTAAFKRFRLQLLANDSHLHMIFKSNVYIILLM